MCFISVASLVLNNHFILQLLGLVLMPLSLYFSWIIAGFAIFLSCLGQTTFSGCAWCLE